MKIQVMDEQIGHVEYTVQQMVDLAPIRLQLSKRVAGVDGEAFDLKSWYRQWGELSGTRMDQEPTHIKVEAVDEFQATIAWTELDQAAFLYSQNGLPIQKGFPLRLYVPDGSSECLNVKSIVKIWFLHDAALSSDATYGFKNEITIQDLLQKK